MTENVSTEDCKDCKRDVFGECWDCMARRQDAEQPVHCVNPTPAHCLCDGSEGSVCYPNAAGKFETKRADLDRRACEAHAGGNRKLYKQLSQELHALCIAQISEAL